MLSVFVFAAKRMVKGAATFNQLCSNKKNGRSSKGQKDKPILKIFVFSRKS